MFVLIVLALIVSVFAQTPCTVAPKGCSSQVLKSSCLNPDYTGCAWSCNTGGAACYPGANPKCKNHNCCQTIPNCFITTAPTTGSPTVKPTSAAPTTLPPTARPTIPSPTKPPTKAPTDCQSACPSIPNASACASKGCCVWGGAANPVCLVAPPTSSPTFAPCNKLTKTACLRRPDCKFAGGKCQDA